MYCFSLRNESVTARNTIQNIGTIWKRKALAPIERKILLARFLTR